MVTQPNNKLSRVLKAMLKELPGQMRAINAAGLASSLALSDTVAAVAGPAAADAAREELQRRLQLVRALQVRLKIHSLNRVSPCQWLSRCLVAMCQISTAPHAPRDWPALIDMSCKHVNHRWQDPCRLGA